MSKLVFWWVFILIYSLLKEPPRVTGHAPSTAEIEARVAASVLMHFLLEIRV